MTMAAPSANPMTNAAPPAAKPDASVYVEPQQPLYVAPSVLSKPLDMPTSGPQPKVASNATTAEVIDEPPPPHTLAKGRYEVKSATIWLVLAAAVMIGLLYVLWRVRMHEAAKKRAREKLTTLKPLGASAPRGRA
jgi:hypothetical protein